MPVIDGTQVAGVVIPRVWDVSWIPTTRLLQDILEDVARHEVEFPRHGSDCVCMDAYSREIRLQVSKAVPPDTGEAGDIHIRLGARARMARVLKMVVRSL